MDERPVYSIRSDLAEWLQQKADENFGGDFERALNTALMIVKAWNDQPDDPWAAVRKQRDLWRGRTARPVEPGERP